MAKIEHLPEIKLELRLILSEEEAAALAAIAGYGTDAFLTVFYENLGKSYLEPHEEGLRSLFDSVFSKIPSFLERTEKARAEFYKK